MYNILTLIFVCVFLTVIDATATQDNLPDTTTECNNQSKYTYSGTDMGSGYYAYPIRHVDCNLTSYLKGLYNRTDPQYPPPAEKCSEEVEGVRLMYIKEGHMYAPVEMLIKCTSNISVSQKIKEYRKFVQRFPRVEMKHDANTFKKHRCQDRGGHMVQPLYATNVCEFEQFSLYIKGKKKTIITDFNDQPIDNVRKFYAVVVDGFVGTENVSSIGCDNKDMRSNLCSTQFLANLFPDSGELMVLSRLHCCCENSNCSTFKRSRKTNMFCLTGSHNYEFLNGEIYSSIPLQMDIYPLDQLILDTACYTTINVSKWLLDSDLFLNIILSHSERVDSDMQRELSNFTTSSRTACKMVVKNGINDTENDIYMVCRENVQESANDTVYFTYDPSTHILQTSKAIFVLLAEMKEKKWTLSKDMSLLLYQCYFHYKPPSSGTQDYCYFYYDSEQRRQLNIVEGKFDCLFNNAFEQPSYLHNKRCGSPYHVGVFCMVLYQKV
ncbi:hypothetical protein DdX_19486 [Ditylenchus destructor]|uniref:Uncharacterized protein n=1 Tax=Ditylenchus destructor TaxID=166010 RepID=A0AAD4MMI8_9BILA|nr:hypothetical protein DdX_19486 [Ditylenchus destructor]